MQGNTVRVKEQRPEECVLCRTLAADFLLMCTSSTHYVSVPMCNAHLAAIRLHNWWLTVRIAETTSTVSGDLLVDASAGDTVDDA